MAIYAFWLLFLTPSFNSEGGKPNFCSGSLCGATVMLFVMQKFYLPLEVV